MSKHFPNDVFIPGAMVRRFLIVLWAFVAIDFLLFQNFTGDDESRRFNPDDDRSELMEQKRAEHEQRSREIRHKKHQAAEKSRAGFFGGNPNFKFTFNPNTNYVWNWKTLEAALAKAVPGDAKFSITLMRDIYVPATVTGPVIATLDGTINGGEYSFVGLQYPLIDVISTTGQLNQVGASGTLNLPDQQSNGVGMLAQINEGKITQCNVSGSITAAGSSSYVGGVAGLNYGTIDGCTSTVSVTGYSSVGGLVGAHDNGVISNSSASGNVTATGYFAGGLIGYVGNGAQVSGCNSGPGTVTTPQYAGGAVGYVTTGGTITQTNTSHNVVGTQFAGGFVGAMIHANSKIDHSNANGTVSGTDMSVAGFVGHLIDGQISKSNANGNVTTGTNFGGGFVGYIAGAANVQDSFANNTVTPGGSTWRVGGFAGSVQVPTVSMSRCYASGSLNAPASGQNGGFAGYSVGALDNVGNAVPGQPTVGLALVPPTNSMDIDKTQPTSIASAYNNMFGHWDGNVWLLSNAQQLPPLK